ncbi:MAG TPA: hypothetical protein VJ691_13940, partial [Vicinamibacterales bacterium]|nr:hypothetical protein [Vicinamibacterales bacterium]
LLLGTTGLNFAAGMTGGVVFAYDPDRALDGRLNGELVAMGGLSEEDEARVLQLLIDHRAITASGQAARLLERWPETLMSFCRVTPKAAPVTMTARPDAVPTRLRA